MEGFFYFFTWIILPIGIPIGLSFYLASCGKMLAAKLLAAVGMAIPFIFMGLFALFISFFGDRMRPYSDEHYRHPFDVINYSSVPLVANANFAYTQEELESFPWDNAVPLSNFIKYDSVPIPAYSNLAQIYDYRYWFDTPIRQDSCIHWPSGFHLTLSDRQGTPLVRIDTSNLDIITFTGDRMQLVVNDSLLNAMAPAMKLRQSKKGGNR